MWIIYKIDKKTKIPQKYKEGDDDINISVIVSELQKNKDYIWAVRFNF